MSTALFVERDAERGGLLGEPVGPLAPGRRDHGVGASTTRTVRELDAGDAPALDDDARRTSVSVRNVDARRSSSTRMASSTCGRAVGAEVADAHRHEPHARQRRLPAEPLGGLCVGTVHLGGGAELEPERVGVVEQVLELVASDVVAEPAADLGGERELAVRERARAAPAGHDVAGRAVRRRRSGAPGSGAWRCAWPFSTMSTRVDPARASARARRRCRRGRRR